MKRRIKKDDVTQIDLSFFYLHHVILPMFMIKLCFILMGMLAPIQVIDACMKICTQEEEEVGEEQSCASALRRFVQERMNVSTKRRIHADVVVYRLVHIG